MIKPTLYTQVTRKITEAERLEAKDPKSTETKAAYAEVSALEEKIAALPNIGRNERNIARRGAITAAVMSGNMERARGLLAQFAREREVPPQLKKKLREYVESPELVYALPNN